MRVQSSEFRGQSRNRPSGLLTWLKPCFYALLFTVHCSLFTGLADAREIGKEEVEEIVREFVLANSGWDAGDVTVSDIDFTGSINVIGEDDVEFEIVPLKKGRFLGLTPLLVKVKASGSVRCSFWMKPIVEVNGDVPVAKSRLKRGQVLKAEDINVVKRRFSTIPMDAILDVNEIVNKIAKREIKQGTPIQGGMLGVRKLVKKGDQVVIIAESGPLRVTAAGQAKEDGTEGKMIKVLNLSSNKVIVGKVVDTSTVAVTF